MHSKEYLGSDNPKVIPLEAILDAEMRKKTEKNSHNSQCQENDLSNQRRYIPKRSSCTALYFIASVRMRKSMCGLEDD